MLDPFEALNRDVVLAAVVEAFGSHRHGDPRGNPGGERPQVDHVVGFIDDILADRKPVLSIKDGEANIEIKGPLSSEELGQQWAEAGISIKPAYVFDGGESDEYSDYFRIGYGEEIMPRALGALIDFVDQHKEAWRLAMDQSEAAR